MGRDYLINLAEDVILVFMIRILSYIVFEEAEIIFTFSQISTGEYFQNGISIGKRSILDYTRTVIQITLRTQFTLQYRYVLGTKKMGLKNLLYQSVCILPYVPILDLGDDYNLNNIL